MSAASRPVTAPLPAAPAGPDGYPRIEDHALLGDGSTAALVGIDGTVRWLCLPRFDGPHLFAALLDRRRGGAWTVQPRGLRTARQRYLPDTAVVVTDLTAEHGTVRIVDGLLVDGSLRTGTSSATGELARLVTVLDGEVELRVHLGGYGGAAPSATGTDEVRIDWRDGLTLRLSASRPVRGLDRLDGTVRLRAGERLGLVLRWAGGPTGLRTADDVAAALDRTAGTWQRWSSCIEYDGPQADLVRRSAITLKMCDHHANGAVVAAPTSSLPEAIGGERNWDYRFTWVRDAAYTVYALRRIGLEEESEGFLSWVLRAYERDGRPHILYTVDGIQPPGERIDPRLEGYRRSAPVRWGNAAADQVQHDVYGEILDCAWQWVRGGGHVDDRRWAKLTSLGTLARERWRTPDHGIWEIREQGRPFTYSVAMCQVAADRLARLAAATGRTREAAPWRELADTIRATLLREAWDGSAGHLTEQLGQPGTVDASLLALPLRRVVDATDPRMTATVRAVEQRLGAGSDLLYRYLPHESPDGLSGAEGAFLLCSFWWVDNLAKSGRIDEAGERFDRLCARANHAGLLPEQIDPSDGAFLGNFPQAFSHIGLISSAVNLQRVRRG
ncbi:MAG TPA: glycoside hydrolase family 15 protein [Actinoplanes sp.]|nr:glycoside hydrolase family 15 protein [Actinoplanes sp.]